MATQQQTFDFEVKDQAVAGQGGDLAVDREPARRETLLEGDDRQVVLRQLRAKVGCISTAAESNRKTTFSTGSTAVDRLLPEGGLRTNAITEWVAEAEGSGAGALALMAAARQLRCPNHGRGPLVVVSDPEHFYPPAAVALGIPAERIIWVRPSRHADLVWSIDQALRCESVAAVWAPVGASLDDRDARRFQLAAEVGRTPGLFIRPAATRHRPSFAEIRLHVANHRPSQDSEVEGFSSGFSSGGRLLRITLDRCRGGRLGESVWIGIRDSEMRDSEMRDHGEIQTAIPRRRAAWENEKATVHLASELAHPKTSLRRSKRAKRA